MSEKKFLDDVIELSDDLLEEAQNFYDLVVKESRVRKFYCNASIPLSEYDEIIKMRKKISLETIKEEIEGYSCCSCDSKKFAENSENRLVCLNCHTVQDDVDETKYVEQEKRIFNKEERDSRKHNEVVTRNKQKRTTFIISNNDPKRQKLFRLQKVENQYRPDSVLRNIAVTSAVLDKVCSSFSIPAHVKEQALKIYSDKVKKFGNRGEENNSVLCGALMIAMDNNKIVRSKKELCSFFETTRKKMYHNKRKLELLLDIKSEQKSLITILNNAVNKFSCIKGTKKVIDYVVDIGARIYEVKLEGFCKSQERINKLYQVLLEKYQDVKKVKKDSPADFKSSLIEYAVLKKKENEFEELIKDFEGFFVGKDPQAITSAVLYTYSLKYNLGMTQNEIARVCEVTEVTLRNRYNDLKRLLKKIGYDSRE